MRLKVWTISYTFRYLNKPFFIWILANLLGFGTLGAMYFSGPVLATISRIIPTTLIITIPIGLAQWIALRRIFGISPLWIFTVPIGLLLGLQSNRVIPESLWLTVDDESILALTTISFLIGLTIGVPQWLVLRRQVPGAIIWVPGSAVGLAGGLWLILVTELIDIPILNTIIPILAYSTTTGLLINHLLTNKQNPQIKTKTHAAP